MSACFYQDCAGLKVLQTILISLLATSATGFLFQQSHLASRIPSLLALQETTTSGLERTLYEHKYQERVLHLSAFELPRIAEVYENGGLVMAQILKIQSDGSKEPRLLIKELGDDDETEKLVDMNQITTIWDVEVLSEDQIPKDTPSSSPPNSISSAQLSIDPSPDYLWSTATNAPS